MFLHICRSSDERFYDSLISRPRRAEHPAVKRLVERDAMNCTTSR